MDEFWTLLCLVLGLGFLIGVGLGCFIGRQSGASKHRKELAKLQSRVDLAINQRVEAGDVWLCDGSRQDIYHLRETCSLTGRRLVPMSKKTMCKGCMKDSLKV